MKKFQIVRAGQILHGAMVPDGESYVYQPTDYYEGLEGYGFRIIDIPEPEESAE